MADTPALLVSPDLLSQGSDLNGRRWAGKVLVEAWAAQLGHQCFHLACADPQFGKAIEPLARQAGHRGAIKLHGLVNPEPYSSIGGLFIPDPSIGRWARWRQAIGHQHFSLIGQTHTLNTPASLAHLEALASEPIQPWDALICTSRASRSIVETVFHDREQELQRRFGTHKALPRPELPVIPLPIPVEAMKQQLQDRDLARQQLGIPLDAHVCLWLGRLSLLTKLDPWPSYQLLQKLATELQQPLWLIECGPDDTPEQSSHFAKLRQLCPSVNFQRLGGPKPVDETTKYQALAAADLAMSLVDNCQETFGLSVIEAMAAGLPVVASDWDGYRDSIRHGLDGFLVPTRWAPGANACSFRLGWQQELNLLSFPAVSGSLAQLVQLEMTAAYAHLCTLLQNPVLAKAMGQQGRRHVEERFTSTAVMQQYGELFFLLRERRASTPPDPAPALPPMRLDPVRLFQSFASYQGSQPWPSPKAECIPEEVIRNRQQLWHLMLEGLSQSQRQELIEQLQRKHL